MGGSQVRRNPDDRLELSPDADEDAARFDLDFADFALDEDILASSHK